MLTGGFRNKSSGATGRRRACGSGGGLQATRGRRITDARANYPPPPHRFSMYTAQGAVFTNADNCLDPSQDFSLPIFPITLLIIYIDSIPCIWTRMTQKVNHQRVKFLWKCVSTSALNAWFIRALRSAHTGPAALSGAANGVQMSLRFPCRLSTSREAIEISPFQ